MIPIKLTLHSFMPYRDTQTIDFTGFRIASICGANGSGKSSIVDAITWALWGETRAKKDVELIHQGQDEVQVEFEFAVGGQDYKVLRKRARPRRQNDSGQSALHLFIDSNGSFKAIDGDTQTQTQRKIEDILHMDYDTFTNSAYLRQGHADEFTTATPAKRKQVLGTILGLGYYDELRDGANERSRKCETEKEQMSLNLTEINAELAQLPVYEEEQKKAQDELAHYEEKVKGYEDTLSDMRQQKEILEGKRAQLTQMEKGLADKSRMLVQIEEQATERQTLLTEHEAVLSHSDEIESGYARFVEAREQNEVLNKNLAVLRRLEQKKNDLDREITRKSQELVKQHAQAQGRVNELEKITVALPRLKGDYQQAQNRLQGISGQEEILRQKKQATQELLVRMQGMESEWHRLEREIEEAGEKLKLLRTQKGAKCPLCGCELGEDGIKHIETEFAEERQTKADTVKTRQTEYKVKQTELKQLNEGIALEERQLSQEKARAHSQIGALEREITRAEEAISLLAEERVKVDEIEQQLTTRNFADVEQEQSQQVEVTIVQLGYDVEKHDRIHRLYEDGKKYESPKQKLDEADRLITREREDLERFEKLAQDLRTELATDRQKREELVEGLKIFPQLSVDLTKTETELKSLNAQQKQVQERLGGIKVKLENLAQLAVRKQEKTVSLNQAIKEEQIYRELTEAFGKKGVQALIIETALPEIENEANRLLARMTDNRMNVKLETQRETQKGDTVETLDIKIADELGTRNYELFSGGEAFRINFAIRIALSRLLARRAGAPLPTLIIDEGFGTQDTVGIEKLREAITTIQDDFEKILVITHIEELRDAFPARIDVVKEANGSKISLN